MEQMKEYPFDFAKPLLLCFDLFNRCNIEFFDENVPFLKKYWRFFYFVPCVVLHYVSIMIYVIGIFTGQLKVSDLAFMVPVFVVITQVVFKAIIIMLKRREVSELVTRLGTIWRTENLSDEQISKKTTLLKRLNLSNLVFYYGAIGVTIYNLLKPLLIMLFRKFILRQASELLLPFGAVFPFDPFKNWFTYTVAYTLQAYTMKRLMELYIGTEILMITLCAHITAEFGMLRDDILQIIPVGNDVINDRYMLEESSGRITIQEFIRRHQILIRLSDQLNFIFNRMIFINLLFATITMCFFGFGAAITHETAEKANYCLIVFCLLCPIYLFCYYGELLIGESGGIADSAYENLWYNGGTQYQKIICFIIMRSQKPCCLTSLEYAPITLKTFTKVVSTTWSYFSMTISVYSED